MSLDDFMKTKGQHAKKAGTEKPNAVEPEASDEIDIQLESPPMPDRLKIALLKRLLEEKNLTQGPPQQQLKVPKQTKENPVGDDFVTAFERFADWIRGRTY